MSFNIYDVRIEAESTLVFFESDAEAARFMEAAPRGTYRVRSAFHDFYSLTTDCWIKAVDVRAA
jgi:hypothetical protein